MARTVLGGVLGGLAMWLVGFIFWGTPLRLLALRSVSDETSTALQTALRDTLGAHGTGVYTIPWPDTQIGSQLWGQGPTAMVFFNNSGLPVVDSNSLIMGLILAILCALLVAMAVRAVAGQRRFAERLTLVALVAVAVTAYTDLGQPIYNHMPWGYFFYLWLSDLLSWIAAGAVIVWMVPKPVKVVAD